MAIETTDVNPGHNADAISIPLDDVDGKKYPLMKQSFGDAGEATQVSETNRLPVKLPSLTHETDIVTVLNEISRKLDILIEYESMMHKIDLKENT